MLPQGICLSIDFDKDDKKKWCWVYATIKLWTQNYGICLSYKLQSREAFGGL
jgi:hypothetical protein